MVVKATRLGQTAMTDTHRPMSKAHGCMSEDGWTWIPLVSD